jgi:FkbM family methyltransferase
MKLELSIDGLMKPVSMQVHDREDRVSAELIESGIWETFETRLFVNRLKPGAVFVDVGANIGYYTVIADQLVGETGAIFAFEPERDNFALLQENVRGCQCLNITLNRAGLSNRNSMAQLYLSSDNLGDHRLYDVGDRESQPIDLVRGDDALAGRVVDFLKIDTQGAESQVIDGMKQTIRNNADHMDVVLEFWPWGLMEAGSSARELIDLLRPFNFHVYIIDHMAHRLRATDCDELLVYTETTLLPEHQGFVNLFLTSNKGEVLLQ